MDTINWLQRLIALDTTSSKSNLDLITMVQDWLHQQHVATYILRDPHQPKANLFATIPASDGRTEGGIVLSGHTDVVPVVGQQWDTDPFVATQVGDKIYGRGACDMKGFLAVVLSLVPIWLQQKLAHPVHLAFSYDEEVGCLGAPLLVAKLKEAKILPAACLVGEPTSMRPVIAHKGIQTFRCRVHGVATHSSLTPQGCNAIEYAARLISHLQQLASALQNESTDNYYDVPFTTLSTNTIQGGTALNIVPSYCEFGMEFRNLPEVLPQTIVERITNYIHKELLPIMQKQHPRAAIEFEQSAAVPSFTTQESEFSKALRVATGEAGIHKVSYSTEAGLFQQAGIPTIVCGPGSIEQAHRPNEYVAVEQLEKCAAVLRKLIL